MKERIEKIMLNENMTSAQFADRIGINRGTLNHVLNGRNKPSLDVVSRIIESLDYINTDWLLKGEGDMYKPGTDISAWQNNASLFDENDILSGDDGQEQNEYATLEPIKKPSNTPKHTENKPVDIHIEARKKISQIIVYYDDNSFERFVPAEK